ncbi:MAG TPA: transglutaminase domain-containing protein [Candidatus Krumholzibacteriaceae bacterium]|nr:transglutaminase domain-containing protein [Candidatus Krumholzibacteriaceae bacterium]
MKILRFLLILTFIPAGAIAGIGDVESEMTLPSACVTGIAFDGENIWTADRKTDRIYCVNYESGEVTKSFSGPGYFMTGLAWDGEYLWVADMDFTNTSTEAYSGKIYKIDPETGKSLGVINTPTPDPHGLAHDGEYLWFSDNSEKSITCISPEDGTTIISFKSPSQDPRGLAWDGEYLWVADRSKDEVYRVDTRTGSVIMILPTPGPYPWGLSWADSKLLVSDYQTDLVSTMTVFGDSRFKRSKERYSNIEFTQDIINFGPGRVEDLNVYLAVPRDRATQEIIDISYGHKQDDFHTDRWGQKVALFKRPTLDPQERFTCVMKVKAKIYDVSYYLFPEKVGSLGDIPEEISRSFLENNDKYRLEDPAIQKAVKEALDGEENPYWIARKIFDHLRENLFYKRVGGWDIAPTIIKRGSGSCSEYAFLYIAMCRAAGIPARYSGAVVVRGEDACYDYVYHRWCEVFLPGYGWIPVDPSGGDQPWPRDQALYFGHLSNRFLITTEGGGASKYLNWDYNSYETYSADGPVQLRMEKIAEWDTAE